MLPSALKAADDGTCSSVVKGSGPPRSREVTVGVMSNHDLPMTETLMRLFAQPRAPGEDRTTRGGKRFSTPS
jgi:hypothetical protein